MKRAKRTGSFMHRLSETIVDRRKIIFLAILICVIFSVFTMGWVEVENDLSSFLPERSDSKAGVDVMMNEFTLYGMAQVMIANVTLEEAYGIKEQIEAVEGIQMVEFGEDESHYNNASACYSLTFDYPQSDSRCEVALDLIKEELANYDSYISSDIGNPLGAILDNEIMLIMAVAGVLILLMLALTSKSLIEVPVILITFLAAMIINMGTNFIYGKVSFVSNSVTSLLQLALSLDYAVILINRYREESERLPQREAVVEALTKSVPEVFGSSLTTVGGMAAMMCMQFKLGPDMAMCLIKAVLFAMLSVFVFMPGLLMVFGKALKKTEHKSLIPDVSFIGKFTYKARKVIVPVFVIVAIGAMFLSYACPFAYGYTSQEAVKLNEQSLAKKMISDNFGSTNMVALVIPGGDYEKEKQLLAELEAREEVDSAMGLANIEAMDGYCLADGLNPRQFSELAGIDYELAGILYAAYAAENEDYGTIINDLGGYEVPLIDIIMFATEMIDSGLVSLEGDQAEMLSSAKGMMESAKAMMVGENYDRMVVYLDMPEDSDATFAFLDEMKAIAKSYYPDGEVYLVGNSTTAKDFKESFVIDNVVVAAVSIITVLIVLLFSFKSIAMPVILILVIQGAIWINFSIPALLDTPLFFLGYIIISAIQMGANIDYAIVIATRYNEVKNELSPRDAIIDTMNFAFPTVITSGAIMSVAGLLIGYMSSEATIASLGQNLGRGTIISIILVLFVLPALLLISDKLVEKTSFNLFKKKEKTAEEIDGRVYLSGKISGEIHGRVEGTIEGFVDGNANITLLSGAKIEKKENEYAE
ncbi:MAG: MMPL family transporter [Clostridia bacterium]|nr:MMPL family transporter [Clostridia bacterium]